LGGIQLLGRFGLFEEVDVGLVLVIFQELRSFFEAYVAWSTAIVDVPFARDVFF